MQSRLALCLLEYQNTRKGKQIIFMWVEMNKFLNMRCLTLDFLEFSIQNVLP